VERYHVELGLVLATQWALPELVVDAISRHHDDGDAGAACPPLVELVRTADAILALLASRPSVDAAALAAEPRVAPSERDAVARVLQRLPAFIASFEGELAVVAPRAKHAPGGGLDGVAALAGRVPLDCRGDVVAAWQQLRCAALAIAPQALAVALPVAVPEHLLVELRLESVPPLACWATTVRSWEQDGRHVALLRPFALGPGAQAAWLALCGGAAQAAENEPPLEDLYPPDPAERDAGARPGVLARMWSAVRREPAPRGPAPLARANR
jgi:hypothetical protein